MHGRLLIAFEDLWEDIDLAPWQRVRRNWLYEHMYGPYWEHKNVDLLYYMPIPVVEPAHYFTPAQRYKKASWRRMFATDPPMITRIANPGSIKDFGELPALQMGAIMPRIQQPLCRCDNVQEEFRNSLSREATMKIEVKSIEDLERPLMVGFCGETWKRRAQRWSGLISVTLEVLLVLLDISLQLCHALWVHLGFLLLPEWLVHFWWPQWSGIAPEGKGLLVTRKKVICDVLRQ